MRPARAFRLLTTVICLGIALSAPPRPSAAQSQGSVPYDIVYVRQPRYGNNTNTTWPEVFHPARMDHGADLMLLHPDGDEELLVDGGDGAVTDPFVSFDGQWVYYSYFYDQVDINTQRDLPVAGADIFRINIQTRQKQQLTFAGNPSDPDAPLPPGEFTPNTGAGNWYQTPDGAYQPTDVPGGFNYLGYGIFNLGPAPIAGGRVAFVSNRNGFFPPKGYTNPTLQLFVMDDDGSNVECIGPLNIGSALHPTPLRDGRLMFSSFESQGERDSRLWGIWSIYPDGRHWEPIASAFNSPQAFHFMTQLSNQDLVVVDYYNLNNNGFGALYRLPIAPPPGTPRFYSAYPSENPPIDQTVGGGFLYPLHMPFTPYGMHSITPFTHGQDEAAPFHPSFPNNDGKRVGKFTHPSAAPNNDLLVVWTAGPANDLNRPTPMPYYDAGIYLVPNGDVLAGPADLVLIKNDPTYNEAWPRAVVPYSAVHGVAEPLQMPWLPNDGSLRPELPAGTPYGLVGTSSFYKRESFPGVVRSWSNTFDGLDAFNTSENEQSSNWFAQGSDAGLYADSDIWAVRLIAMEPNTHRSYGPENGQHFFNFANEKLRILGEIPLRKFNGANPVLDPEGHPDTSFLAKIPADTPFTFQTIDRNGLVLNMAQTWHQLRPGEVRNDCGGCHAHSQQPLSFASTAAAQPSYSVYDLSKVTPLLTKDAGGNPSLRIENSGTVDVEFYRDIRPILQAHCVQCHTQSNPTPPGNLVLDDVTTYNGTSDLSYGDYIDYPGDYARLARDNRAKWGYPPLVNVGGPLWRQTNASRYVRSFQSRRSLLVWKIFGQRLDGWSNADHPTESVPGNAATLPPGASINEADLNFTGTIMPPVGSGVPPLSWDQKMTIARWIDLGCPIDLGQDAYGWFLDDVRPALTISAPRPGANNPAPAAIRIGVADANSGIDLESLSITADFSVGGRAAGTELADLALEVGDGIYSIGLGDPIAPDTNHHVIASVADQQGNIARLDREFFVGDPPPTPTPSPPPTCAPAPRECRTAGRSTLRMESTPQRLSWKWLRGAATTAAELGNPVSGGTGYQLCLYQDAALVRTATLPSGGTCGSRPCWNALGARGYRYRDSSGVRDGFTMVLFKEGSAGRAKIIVKSEGGPALPALPIPLDATVTAQLIRLDDPATCWEATYPQGKTSDAEEYKAGF